MLVCLYPGENLEAQKTRVERARLEARLQHLEATESPCPSQRN